MYQFVTVKCTNSEGEKKEQSVGVEAFVALQIEQIVMDDVSTVIVQSLPAKTALTATSTD